MSMTTKPNFLRTILLLDAATCAVMGAALGLAAAPIARLTDIPPGLLLYAGLILLPIAAFIAIVAARPAPSLVWLVILGNLGWVAASVLLLVSGWIAPNGLGYAFIAVQAIAVAIISKLEHGALRQTTPAAA